jgi:hypothetical protein
VVGSPQSQESQKQPRSDLPEGMQAVSTFQSQQVAAAEGLGGSWLGRICKKMYVFADWRRSISNP